MEKQVEVLRKVLEDKEREIKDAKDKLCQAKEDAIREYLDSNEVIKELGISFADGFNDCFCQVKASFLDLDLSHITINAEGQTLTHHVDFEGPDKLFADDTNLDPQGDGEAAHTDQEKFVKDSTRQLEGDQTVEEKNEKTPAVQQ